MHFEACPCLEYCYVSPLSGHGAAWLARPSGGRKAVSSNLAGPTTLKTSAFCQQDAGVIIYTNDQRNLK